MERTLFFLPQKGANFKTSGRVDLYKFLYRPLLKAILTEDIKTKKGLRFFLRVRLSLRNGELYATTTGDQGSGILKSMIKANGLMIVPEDKEKVKAGERVDVQVLDRTFELESQKDQTF